MSIAVFTQWRMSCIITYLLFLFVRHLITESFLVLFFFLFSESGLSMHLSGLQDCCRQKHPSYWSSRPKRTSWKSRRSSRYASYHSISGPIEPWKISILLHYQYIDYKFMGFRNHSIRTFFTACTISKSKAKFLTFVIQ